MRVRVSGQGKVGVRVRVGVGGGEVDAHRPQRVAGRLEGEHDALLLLVHAVLVGVLPVTVR